MSADAVGLAILGAGRMGRFHAECLRNSTAVSVLAVADTSPPALEAAQKISGDVALYETVDAAIAHPGVEACLIATPSPSHPDDVRASLAAGLHVLCEKPFLWGPAQDARDLGREARELVGAFVERGLILRENCQWPETLPAFGELFPGALDAPPETFAMRLAPASIGRELIGDALPHALSLLQALAPAEAPRLSDIRFSTHAWDARALRVDFRYHAQERAVEARVELRVTDSQPREAAYALDGRRARRDVRLEDYALTLVDEDDGRSVPLPDPLGRLITRFVADLEHAVTGAPKLVEGVPATPNARGERGPAREIWQRMSCLDQLVRTFDAGA